MTIPTPSIASVADQPINEGHRSVPASSPKARSTRMAVPLAKNVLKEIAAEYGVCVRPIAIRRTDVDTGQTEIMEVPCGARLTSKCKPCAEKNRRLRLQQLREGWHLNNEPDGEARPANTDERALVQQRAQLEFERYAAQATSQWDRVTELDGDIAAVSEELAETNLRGTLPQGREPKAPPRKRSTKRRQEATDLPRMNVDSRTIGRTYVGKDGTVHCPSMLITLTLGSYGDVHTPARPHRLKCSCGQSHHPDDPKVGTPVEPASYDYRRAALDAIHFARLTDRFWQNLRRAVGYNVQYGGCVELQKRLAPHGHFAIRGSIPRKLIAKVAEATYHQVWWPAHDQLQFDPANPPRWSQENESWIDPTTNQPLNLPTWEEALDELDAQDDPQPAHVVTCGRIDARGVKGGTKDAERSIRYITKYLAKDITEHVAPTADAQRAHFDRMHAELSVLPCSPTCANWLLYGIQPKNSHKRLDPGNCRGKVHQRTTLGFTGRRVLISRKWSGKTLTDHRDDNRAWVQALLGLDPAVQSQVNSRYLYELCRRDDPDLPPQTQRIMRAVSARIQWRAALKQAQQLSAKDSSTADHEGKEN